MNTSIINLSIDDIKPYHKNAKKHPKDQIEKIANSILECVFNYPYLNVTIKYSDKVVDKWKNGKDIVPYLVHEMCHPITDPLYTKANSRYVSVDEILAEREKLTDYICNIVIKNKII